MFLLRNSCKLIISTLQRYAATEASTVSKREEYYKKLGLQGTQDNETPKEWDTALPFEKLPKAPSVPLLGSMYKLLPGGEYYGKHFLEYSAGLRKKLGDIFYMTTHVGRNDMVQCFNPDDCQTLLRNEGAWPIRRGNQCFTHYRNVTRKDIFQGVGGVLTTEGEEWFNIRSKVNPIMMQPRITKKYVQSMDLVVNDLLDNIRHISQIDNEMPADFLKELYKWSLESIALVALDKRLGCLNRNMENDSPKLQYINAVTEALDLMFHLDVMPSFYKYFPTPTWKKFLKLMDFITFTNLQHIEEAEKNLQQKTDSDHEPSVLEKLLKIDKKIAVIMAMDMLIAGIDTTGRTLGAALYFLAKNPEKQAKLREEILEKLPEKNSPVTTDVLEQSRYLKAVVRETTRIVPIGVGVLRTTTRNIVLGGYQIPKGTDVIAMLLLESMSGSQFKRPREFIPERWLKSMDGDEISHKNAHRFVNLPFGFGPRSCIGQRLANLELEVAICKIVRNFELEWKHEDMKFGGKLLYGIEDPLRLTIKEISK